MKNQILLTFFLTALLFGCGGGGNDEPQNKSVVIHASKNSTASGELDGIQVIIPAGTFTDEVSVEMQSGNREFPILSNESSHTEIKLLFQDSKLTHDLRVSAPTGDEAPDLAALKLDGYWEPLIADDSGAFIIKADDINNSSSKAMKDMRISFSSANEDKDRNVPGIELFRLSGTGEFGEPGPEGVGSALFVHGILSNGQNPDFADHIRQSHGYRNVYGVTYRFNDGVEANAHRLADLISSKNLPDKSVDIWAHSMGGLISRFMIEQNLCSLPVKRLYTLDTPHLGSAWATPFSAWLDIMRIQLNGTGLVGAGIFFPSTQFVKDLVPGSQVTETLNKNYDPHRAEVDYFFVANSRDGVVQEGSQVASGVLIEAHASGAFYRGTLTAGEEIQHNPLDRNMANRISSLLAAFRNHSVLKEEGGRIILTNGFPQFNDNGLQILSDAYTVNSEQETWKWSLKINNTRSHSIVVEELIFANYDKNGQYHSQQWAGKIPGAFPHVVTRIDHTVNPKESSSWQIETFPGTEINRTMSVQVIARIYDPTNGTHHAIKKLFTLIRGLDKPFAPQLRSTEVSNQSDGGRRSFYHRSLRMIP